MYNKICTYIKIINIIHTWEPKAAKIADRIGPHEINNINTKYELLNKYYQYIKFANIEKYIKLIKFMKHKR